jgi:glycosyltransferase involved in cell wall biosynthesis
MNDITLTILTVTHNAGDNLRKTLDSLYSQKEVSFNHLIQDAHSTDGSLYFLNAVSYPFTDVIREVDSGIYDALNRGLKRIPNNHDVLILHAGDTFISPETLGKLVRAKRESSSQLVYSNIIYTNKLGKTVRSWRAGYFSWLKMHLGWMPPHTSILCEKSLFQTFGNFKTNYNISGDYDWLLRVFGSVESRAIHYFDEYTIAMDLGGLSTSGVQSELNKIKEDRLAIIDNLAKYYLLCLISKKLRKIHQRVKIGSI